MRDNALTRRPMHIFFRVDFQFLFLRNAYGAVLWRRLVLPLLLCCNPPEVPLNLGMYVRAALSNKVLVEGRHIESGRDIWHHLKDTRSKEISTIKNRTCAHASW